MELEPANTDAKAQHSDQTEYALLSERVTEGLRSLILSGELKPGSRIGQEEIAQRFNTSRIPVREALRRLENDGLVILVPNSGAWVAKLDLDECVEVYKIRERLEPLAMNEAVKKISDAEISNLEQLLGLLERSSDQEEFLRRDREFHLAAFSASKMPRLIAMVERFWNTTQHYRRAFVGLVPPVVDSTIEYEHRLMLAAIKRRDAEEAERLLYGHIRRTRMELEAHKEVFHSAEKPKRKRRSKQSA